MGGISQQQLTQLKVLIRMIKSDPSMLHLPELGFLKKWLESMGAKIPPPPPNFGSKDMKTDFGSPTEGCDSQHHNYGKFNRQRFEAKCPLTWKRKQGESKGNSKSAQKKWKVDLVGSRGTSKERDTSLSKEVSDITCDVIIKQEPLSDEDYFTEANKAYDDFSGVLVRPLISTVQNTNVLELPVIVKQEVDENEDSVTDVDIEEEQKIGQRGVQKQFHKQAPDIRRSHLARNTETFLLTSSDKSITDNLANIDTDSTDNRNIVTQAKRSKSVETISSKLLRKVAENNKQTGNGGFSMDRRNLVTTVVRKELDDDSDNSEADECKEYMVVAEWTDQQLQKAGISDAEEDYQEENSSDGPIVKHPGTPEPDDFLRAFDPDEFPGEISNYNTKKKTESDVKLFSSFLMTKDETRIPEDIPPYELDKYVCQFIVGITKKDGSEYEATTLRGFISSLDRHLKRTPSKMSIFNDVEFAKTRAVLKRKLQQLKSLGLGNRPKAARSLTEDDIEAMLEAGTLGDKTPKALIHSMWLICTSHFGMRTGKERHDLCWGDVKLGFDEVSGEEYVMYDKEIPMKTQPGSNPRDTRMIKPKAYANSENEQRDPVYLYKLYRSKRPEDMLDDQSPFFLTPCRNEHKCWFKKSALGVNKIYNMMNEMKEEAGIYNPKIKLYSYSSCPNNGNFPASGPI